MVSSLSHMWGVVGAPRIDKILSVLTDTDEKPNTLQRRGAQANFACAPFAFKREIKIMVALVLDLFANEGAVRKQVLDGSPVLVLPAGVHHRYGLERDVTPGMIREFEKNFANRESVGIRRKRVAVDVDHMGGAVGWYKEVTATERGVEASFSWNDKGRGFLTGDEYAYFSPTIAWDYEDQVTGQNVSNQIVGGALTNYPFFGEETALYKYERSLWCGENLTSGGYGMSENLVTEEAVEGGVKKFLLSMFKQARVEADAEVVPPVAQVDVSEFNSKLEAMQAQFDTQVTTLTSERDAAAARVTVLEGNLGTVEDLRAVERYAAQAESFSYLPVQEDELGAELRWLNESDVSEGKAHVAFFSTLLKAANSEYAERFATIGGRGTPAPDSVIAEIDADIVKYQVDHTGVSYSDAVKAVALAQPALYAKYRLEVI